MSSEAEQTLADWLPALLKEAELGNPDAMGILAHMYKEGIGVKKDLRESLKYAAMEKNAPPFNLPDNDNTNPWLGKETTKI